MILDNQKTSLLIPSQLPEFVRDEPSYQKFVLFLQSYYEWLEQNNNVTDRTKNLLNYNDVDNTTSEFLDYFYNEFLTYFPQDILSDKQKVIKLAKELYQSKGTPAAYKFLFRVLYDSDVEFFYRKDAILKPSSGKWYIAKSLKLATENKNFLNISNLRLIGETTKSIATVENSVFSGTRTEVFISNIERLFQSGEFVRVVDTNNQDVYFLNGEIVPSTTVGAETLRAKIVGQISQIKIDPVNRGLLYQPGDPVVVYGGLNSPTGHGAEAIVGETTSGSIQRIKVESGGYGYTNYPNTIINLTDAPGAVAIVGSLDPDGASDVSLIPLDYIGKKHLIQIGASDYHFGNIVTSNANTTLAEAFTFTGFTTYPISSVLVQNGGGGITKVPVITAESTYLSEDDAVVADLKTLGILAPIQILNGGLGYEANDDIDIVGGSGLGAHAQVLTVNSAGSIQTVGYMYDPNSPYSYPLGGMGFKTTNLPTLNVISANTEAYGASLSVPGILGDGATFTPTVDRVGSITSISMLDNGEDYIASANISLKVQDMVVRGLEPTNVPQKGEIVYQGSSQTSATYLATVDSTVVLVPNADPEKQLYRVRVFDYTTKPNFSLPLIIDSRNITMYLSDEYTSGRYDSTGVITYGDGTAKASASFLNGLVISNGQYLDKTGQPSSFDVLQSTKYNNYTYEITLEKEISRYKKVLLDLLHPTGLNVIGRYAMNTAGKINMNVSGELDSGHTLGYYTGNTGSYAYMTTDWDNKSNNIIKFDYLVGTNLQNVIVPGAEIVIKTDTDGLKSEVIEVGEDYVTIKDSKWLTISNVATVTAITDSNIINIVSLTNSYDAVNNGMYNDANYPLKDIVKVGDTINIPELNFISDITNIDYENGILYTNDNVAQDVSNALISIKKTFLSTDVKIFNLINN